MATPNSQTPEDLTADYGHSEDEDVAASTKSPAVTSTATTPTAVATTTPVNVLAPASAAPSPIAPATASPVAPAATPSPVAPAAAPKGAPGAATAAKKTLPAFAQSGTQEVVSQLAQVPPETDEETTPDMSVRDAAKDEYRKKVTAIESRMNQAIEDSKALNKALEKDAQEAQGLLKPFKAQEYEPPKPKGIVEQWGSAAMIFAMLGSMFTRNHAVTALNAAAAAINGFKEGNKEVADQAYKNWKIANDNARAAQDAQNKRYDEIMKGVKERALAGKTITQEQLATARAELTAASTAYRDDLMAEAAKDNNLNKAMNLQVRREVASLQMEFLGSKATEAKRVQDANETWRKKSQEPSFQALPFLEQVRYVEGLGSPEATSWMKNARLMEAQTQNQIKQGHETEAYQLAVKNGDVRTQLMIDADNGSKDAAKKLANYQERALKKQLTPEEVVEQEIADQAIASYQAEMPKMSSKSPEAVREYNSRLARVSKIAEQNGYKFNPDQYKQATKSEGDWRNGNTYIGKQMASINALSGHLEEAQILVDVVKKAREGEFDQSTWNTIKKRASEIIGDPDLAVAGVNAAAKITMDELTKFILGSAGALADREGMEKLMTATGQTDITSLNLSVLNKYVIQRAKALEQQYTAATRKDESAFAELLTPKTLERYGKDLNIPKDVVDAKVKREKAAAARAGAQESGAPSASTSGAAGGAPAAGGAAPKLDQSKITKENLESTAKKRGITVEEVKKQLKAKYPDVKFEGE